jgi:hypothetical protein
MAVQGLCNAPATFERLMETVLRGLTYDSCLEYLANVIVIVLCPKLLMGMILYNEAIFC